jgi:predicted SpoU family rRNA methylase
VVAKAEEQVMSLNKPEINYDTALYALQENVVLKQKQEEWDKGIAQIHKSYYQMLLDKDKEIIRESENKQLYQRRVEKQYKEIQDLTLQINSKPHWILNTTLVFLIVDFIFSVWIFCQIPFTK